MIEYNTPVYTVHDNFISTPDYSGLIPKLYSGIFMTLSPLALINGFIIDNIFRNEYQDNKYDFVISHEHLSKALHLTIPDNLSKKDRELWESKIASILVSYNTYIKHICGVYDDSNKYVHDIHELFDSIDCNKKYELYCNNLTKFRDLISSNQSIEDMLSPLNWSPENLSNHHKLSNYSLHY